MTIRNLLHDEIDELEENADRAKEIVYETITEHFAKAVLSTGDVPKAMMLVAKLVENELSDLTTKSFQAGLDFAKRRNGKSQNDSRSQIPETT